MLIFGAKSCVYVTLFLFSFGSAGRRISGASRRGCGRYGWSKNCAISYRRNIRPYTALPYAWAVRAMTPRYTLRTQPTVRSSQSIYNPPGYSQPGYNQLPTVNPTIISLVTTNQPGYNHSPGYHPSYSQPSYGGTNFHQPGYGGYGGAYGYRKDHGTRNAVFAGLGGSLLGAYLGYHIDSWSSAPGANPAGTPGSNDDVPRYSVVHYYYTGDYPIPKNVSIQSNAIGKCDNTTSFCPPNSDPLCMANGTVYCITPMDSTVPCAESACVNSTIDFPCVDANGAACKTTSTNVTSIQIPCVTSISIFGSISSKFCVTVIANPVPKPEQFIKYVNENPEVKQEVSLNPPVVAPLFVTYLVAWGIFVSQV